MREVEVLQRDGADRVLVWLTVLVVAGVAGDVLGQDVLALEQHIEVGSHLIERPLAAFEGCEERREHIWVVRDLIKVEVVLVVVVRGLVAVEVVLQFSLHRRVCRLSREHILVGAWIGREADAVQPAL